MQYEISKEDFIHGGKEKDFYAPDEVESCPCPLCGTSQFTPVHTERGNIGVVICKNCHLIYTNPRVKNSSENYFGDAALYYEEARLIFKGKKTHHRDRNYEYEFKEIKKLKPAGKLLDIGPNMGFFLRKANEFGFDAEGVEPSASLAEIAIREFGLKITNSYFEKSVFPEKSFDIITMIDVFEHVNNPKELLSAAHSVLKDAGLMCIKVPNGNYNLLKLKLGKMLGKTQSHDIFDSYEHVVHYSPLTMKKMLSENGFRIMKLIIPLPIHTPLWANLVGHYYQYPSPFILDWKRIFLRNTFHLIGKMQKMLGIKITFAPDLMFMIVKK